jgi:GWxTD domain-containing protein
LIILFFLLFSSIIISQPVTSNIYSEINIIPDSSSAMVYYSYRVPFNRIVFEKHNGNYDAAYQIQIEVFDSASNFVTRQIRDHSVATRYFNNTNSSDFTSEGLIEFNLKPGSYELIPIYSDKNSNRQIKLKPEKINLKELLAEKYLPPIVLSSSKKTCGNVEASTLGNFEGNIPFSEQSYDLIFPVNDKSINSIFVTIIKNKDTVFAQTISEKMPYDLKITECSNNIMAELKKGSSNVNNFILRNINKELTEGMVIFFVSDSKNSSEKKRFNIHVKWFNKPLSLNKIEFAIRSLKYMESKDTIDNLLKQDSDNYQQVLFDYWKKYDPNPQTAFNPLMMEYYSRIDHASRNFPTITGKSGLDTDRGKVYIQFGNPKSIERTSNEQGKVVETWIYENPLKTFIFIDERGTGNFSLKN